MISDNLYQVSKQPSGFYGNGQMLQYPKYGISGRTLLLVRVEDDWIEASISDLAKPEWKAPFRVLTWNGFQFMTAQANKPRMIGRFPYITCIETENTEKIFCSPSTQIAIDPTTAIQYERQIVPHLLVGGLKLAPAYLFKKDDLLSTAIENGYILNTTLEDILGSKLLKNYRVSRAKTAAVADGRHFHSYSIRVPVTGNLLLSNGMILRCDA